MNDLLVVLDIETTGLNPRKDVILEIGVLIANLSFEPIAHREILLKSYVDWSSVDEKVLNMHNTRHPNDGYPYGLIEDSLKARAAERTLNEEQAANRLIGFLEAHGVVGKETYMMGSTIGFDRGFLDAHVPELNDWFHYRSIDVSSHQATIEMYWPESALENKPSDRKIHRAYPDCVDTLAKYAWAVATMKGGTL